jgi:hypothetical protein
MTWLISFLEFLGINEPISSLIKTVATIVSNKDSSTNSPTTFPEMGHIANEASTSLLVQSTCEIVTLGTVNQNIMKVTILVEGAACIQP